MTAPARRVREPRGVMRSWQVVLEAFALDREPQTWVMGDVRIDPVDKFEAVAYLVEKGLLEQTGRIRQEHCDALYQITPAGQFAWDVGLTELKRRKRPGGRRQLVPWPTLAERTVAVSPTSVFNLAERPWTYSMRRERLHEFGEAA